MRMNSLGFWSMNNPVRASIQRRYLLPAFCRIGGPLSGCRVLEVGCGRGAGLALLRQAGATRADGIDLDPVMVRLARRTAGTGVLVAVADIGALPMPADSYDVVVDFGAIHLIPDWRTGIAEVTRVLRPGGRFLFEQPAHPLYRRLMPLSTGCRIPGDFGRAAFLADLEHQGLRLTGLARPGLLAFTGMLGDLVGVAVAPEG
jgi:SAM-dependent methyltransferase